MIKETSIVEAVSTYLGERSFHIVKEMPFLRRHIDIVGFDSQKSTLIAVEAKVTKWQSAIEQAITCLLFAHEVYIAMPAEYVHRVDRTELDRYGIGLLEVDTTVNVAAKAVSSRYTSEHHRNAIIERLNMFEVGNSRGDCDVRL